MKNDKYIGLKKILALIASIGLWGVSMYFSYKGFEFESTEVLWFGFVLAGVVTVVELVFNTKIGRLNHTLLAAGILCYVYGSYTNVTGFYILQRGTLDGFFTGSNWLIPIFAGLMCEILPEALFAWAVGAARDGDLIGNVSDMFGGEEQSNGGRRSDSLPSRPFTPPNFPDERSSNLPRFHGIGNDKRKRN